MEQSVARVFFRTQDESGIPAVNCLKQFRIQPDGRQIDLSQVEITVLQ